MQMGALPHCDRGRRRVEVNPLRRWIFGCSQMRHFMDLSSSPSLFCADAVQYVSIILSELLARACHHNIQHLSLRWPPTIAMTGGASDLFSISDGGDGRDRCCSQDICCCRRRAYDDKRRATTQKRAFSMPAAAAATTVTTSTSAATVTTSTSAATLAHQRAKREGEDEREREKRSQPVVAPAAAAQGSCKQLVVSFLAASPSPSPPPSPPHYKSDAATVLDFQSSTKAHQSNSEHSSSSS